MDSRAKKQEMCRLGENSDFISNLPSNVTDQILVRLPIRDAVRTSVLSTNWRYKWTTITQLVFHDNQLVLPSRTFIGFSHLKSLCLHRTTFDNKGGFEYLISKCPVLERLTLNVTNRLGHLNLCSPNLKYLCLSGDIVDVCFENTPLLSHVSIHTGYFNDENLKKFLQSETLNMVKVLSSLPNLRNFVVGIFFLKFLTMGKIPEKLPFTCHHLNNLTMLMNFEDVNDICVTLCLLNSSPNLRELDIQFYSISKSGHNIKNFWEGRTLVDWNMSGLQIVKITNIRGFELELEFIKLLMANSPMLEMLSIRSGDLDIQDYKGSQFLKKLLICPRASPKAKIKFLEEDEE